VNRTPLKTRRAAAEMGTGEFHLTRGSLRHTPTRHVDCRLIQPKRTNQLKGQGSPYSITERRIPELISVLGSQPAGDVSRKPGGRLPLLSARPAVTPATLKTAATNFAAW